MSRAFDEFRSVVLGDPALQQALDAVAGEDEFAGMASRLARERGLELSAADVLLELQRARHSWLLRMLP